MSALCRNRLTAKPRTVKDTAIQARIELSRFGGKMAQPKLKRAAVRLFAQGFTPREVSEKVGSSLRTTQRWHKQFLEQNPSFQDVGKIPVAAIAPISVEPQTQPQPQPQPKSGLRLPEDWQEIASKLSNQHLGENQNIRVKLGKILNNCLNYPELNARVLNQISQCYARHLAIEQETASLNLLSADRAFALLESLGYSVIDPRYIQEEES